MPVDADGMIVGQNTDEALAIAVGQADKPYLDATCGYSWQRILSFFEFEVLVLVIEISHWLLAFLTLSRLTKSDGQLLLTIGTDDALHCFVFGISYFEDNPTDRALDL